MRKFGLITCGLMLAAAPMLLAARAPSGPANPQISYTRVSGGGYQLVVANEDGGGAAAIDSSARMLSGQLGPDGNIYFWEGGHFKRMPATGGAVRPLFDNVATIVRQSDLSKDGASVAWFNPTSGDLYRYDIATGQQNLLAHTPGLIDLTYDYTDSSIIFVQQVSDTQYALNSVAVGGGPVSSLGLTGPITAVDSARGDGTLALTMQSFGVAPYIALWKPGLASPMRIVDGYNATYRCNDSAILFVRMTSPGPVIYRRLSNSALTAVTKANATFPSYRPIC